MSEDAKKNDAAATEAPASDAATPAAATPAAPTPATAPAAATAAAPSADGVAAPAKDAPKDAPKDAAAAPAAAADASAAAPAQPAKKKKKKKPKNKRTPEERAAIQAEEKARREAKAARKAANVARAEEAHRKKLERQNMKRAENESRDQWDQGRGRKHKGAHRKNQGGGGYQGNKPYQGGYKGKQYDRNYNQRNYNKGGPRMNGGGGGPHHGGPAGYYGYGPAAGFNPAQMVGGIVHGIVDQAAGAGGGAFGAPGAFPGGVPGAFPPGGPPPGAMPPQPVALTPEQQRAAEAHRRQEEATRIRYQKMSPGERATAVREQLEYYFSRDNLQQDQFMVSQMNSQMYVPVAVLAGYRKMVLLGATEGAIAQAARSSARIDVSADGKMCRPAGVKTERNTLILRDVPQGTQEPALRAFLVSGKQGPLGAIDRDPQTDVWFVTFEGNDQAVNCALWLRMNPFNGATVKARLKSENLMRSFFDSGVGGAGAGDDAKGPAGQAGSALKRVDDGPAAEKSGSSPPQAPFAGRVSPPRGVPGGRFGGPRGYPAYGGYQVRR